MSVIKDEDFVIDYDDVAEAPPTVQNPEAEGTLAEAAQPEGTLAEGEQPEGTLADGELPEVEVDEWIDLEDRWEKDYFYVIFTDDELYQHAYGLYFTEYKDSTVAQSLAKQQVVLLKQTLRRMEADMSIQEHIPGNLIPILKSSYENNESQFGFYLKEYEKALKLPYLEGQELLKSILLRVYRDARIKPFVLPNRRLETRLNPDWDARSPEARSPQARSPEEEQEGGAAKPAKAAKPAGAKPAGAKAKKEKTEMFPEIKKMEPRTRVIFANDGVPLPLDGVEKLSKYPMPFVPSLYLKERVDWEPPTLQESISVETIDWKAPSNIYRALNDTSLVPFATVLAEITELPSVHRLEVLMETYGYRLEGLIPEQHKELMAHLLKLPAGNRPHKTTKSYVWKDVPRTGLNPADGNMFLPLKQWVTDAMAYLEKKRDTYVNHLNLLEKQTDVFTLHPAATPDIYTLAVRIREGQIDLEEAANALMAMEKQATTESYVTFLRALLTTEWNMAEMDAALQAMESLNHSVVPEKRPILTEYISDAVAKQGIRTFLLEDHYYDASNGWTFETEDIGMDADEPKDGRVGETIAEPIVAVEAESGEWGGIEMVMDTDATTQWASWLPPDTSVGTREILLVVARMLNDLHTMTELPIHLKTVFDFLRPRLTRLSQLEQMSQAFPDIPREDLTRILEQKKLALLGLSASETERFRKTYMDVTVEYKKSIIDQFLYALTWWVIQLQNQYIRNPKQIMPAFESCMPVWAFYGIPMSSSDEKGIAKYLVCVIDVLLQNESNRLWSLIKGIPEKKLLDRIYKNSQLPEFTKEVDYLKQQWKDRWKEVARKEKELEIRLETLEKATHQPVVYKTLYVELMRHLPTLIQQRDFKKKEAIVFPVANSCCYQPLNASFEAFQDFKSVGLYEHRERLKGSAGTGTGTGAGMGSRFGKVTIPEDMLRRPQDSSTFYTTTRCPEDIHLPTTEPQPDTVFFTKTDWNKMVDALGKPEWALPVLTTEDATTPLTQLSTSSIRRSTQALRDRIQNHISNGKREWALMDDFIQFGTWYDKQRLLQYMALLYVQERSHFSKLPWMESYADRCMAQWSEWRKILSMSRQSATTDVADGLMDLMNYWLLLGLILPSLPAPDETSFVTRLNGTELEFLDPQWLQAILERRFTLLIERIQIVQTPSQTDIHDYYAMMRERLKESSLAEYNSKTIEEIKEMQDAKRLNLKPVYDTLYGNQKTNYNAAPGALKDAETKDEQIETEGIQDFRTEAWNPDDMDEERLS
jgi:hypothetical protein